MKPHRFAIVVMLCVLSFLPKSNCLAVQDAVKIALSYPETGPFAKEGKDQWRAAQLAVSEINAVGGIFNRKIELLIYDTASSPQQAVRNVQRAIDIDGAKMIFGGASSDVAIAVSSLCEQKKVPFFIPLAYSTAVSGMQERRFSFTECNNSWMSAKALAAYLNKNFSGKKFFYITSDNTWGWTTEAAIRKFSRTQNSAVHERVMTPVPSANYEEVLNKAAREKPDVLVLTLFGTDMAAAVRTANQMGLNKKMQIVVPNLNICMAELASPGAMEGIIGTVPWTWQVPYKYGFQRGIQFIEDFAKRYERYPSSSAASTYTIMHEYKAAVERAGSFDSQEVVKALEGHRYQLLKDQQVWRDFDHQSIQTIYLVRCNPADLVVRNKYNLDYFDIVESFSGEQTAQTRAEWNSF